MTCYQALGRIEDARHELDALIERRTKNSINASEQLKEFHLKKEEITTENAKQLAKWKIEAKGSPFTVEYLRGVQFLSEGDPQAATVYFRNAEMLNPGVTLVKIKLGQAFIALKLWNRAEECFKEALKLDPDSPGAHLGLAWTLIKLNRYERAAEVALNAIALNFANPSAHYLLGVALENIEKYSRSIEALRVCVSQNPNHIYAHERLAFLYEERIGNPEAAKEHRRLARNASDKMTELQVKDLNTYLKTTAVTTSDNDVFAPPQNPSVSSPISDVNCITIVSGLPRSGTSMMMYMLKKGGLPLLTDQERVADTHNPQGYFEYSPVKSVHKDASWVENAKGKVVKVIAQLLIHMPRNKQYHYRVIFMERDLDEVIYSQRDLLEYRDECGSNLDSDEMKQTYRRQLNNIRQLLAVGRFSVLYVNYHDCTKNAAKVANQVNRFIGGSLNEQAMAKAVDINLYRHRMEKSDATGS